MLHDLRDAVRTLRSNSSFTIVAVVVLALGIGFSIAIFSVVNAVFFRPRAVAAPNQLVHVYGPLTATSGSATMRARIS